VLALQELTEQDKAASSATTAMTEQELEKPLSVT
jgi:hypothetical protein